VFLVIDINKIVDSLLVTIQDKLYLMVITESYLVALF
jgi:hypothetical protein